MKKEEKDIGFLNGSRTIKDDSNPSIYMGFKRKSKQKKKEKEEEDGWITGNGSRTVYIYEEIPATPVLQGFSSKQAGCENKMVIITINTSL